MNTTLKISIGVVLMSGFALTAMAQDNFPNPPDNHWASDTPIRVVVNDRPIHFNGVQPEEVDGRVLVPLRGVFEDIGAYVHWNAATETVTCERGPERVTLQIGNHRAHVDGREVNLDVPPILVQDYTLVPLRFISEALGADVDWRDQEQTVAISTVHRQRVATVQTERVRTEEVSPRPQPMIEQNTILTVVLDRTLSSRNAQQGDRFVATERARHEGPLTGARIHGVVTDVKQAIEGAPGVLQIRLTRIDLSDGTQLPIRGTITASDQPDFVVAENGIVMANRRWFRHERNHDVVLRAGTPIQISISPRGPEIAPGEENRYEDEEDNRPRRQGVRPQQRVDDDGGY